MLFKKSPTYHTKTKPLSDSERIVAAASDRAKHGIYPVGMGYPQELWRAMCLKLLELDARVKELERDQSSK